MNQQKTGLFLKELRNKKQLTQSQFAEMIGVSNRTVSRWETGVHMPDFDVLIEIADFYKVDIREILEGERTNQMDAQRKADLLMAADYTNHEKQNLSRLMRCLFSAGLVAMAAYFILNNTGNYVFLCNFLLGSITGVLLLGVVVTTRYMARISEFKLRLLNSKKRGNET